MFNSSNFNNNGMRNFSMPNIMRMQQPMQLLGNNNYRNGSNNDSAGFNYERAVLPRNANINNTGSFNNMNDYEQQQQSQQFSVNYNNNLSNANMNNFGNGGMNNTDFFRHRDFNDDNSNFRRTGRVANNANNNSNDSGAGNNELNSIGIITTMNNQFGLIDEEIVFERKVCVQFIPEVTDRVIYEKVFAPQGKFNWVATRVALYRSQNEESTFQQQQPNAGSSFQRNNLLGNGGYGKRTRSPPPLAILVGRNPSPLREPQEQHNHHNDAFQINWRELAAKKRIQAEQERIQMQQSTRSININNLSNQPAATVRNPLSHRYQQQQVQQKSRPRELIAVQRSIAAPPPPKIAKLSNNMAAKPIEVSATPRISTYKAVKAQSPVDLVIFDYNAPDQKICKSKQNIVLRAIEKTLANYLISSSNPELVEITNAHFDEGKLLMRVVHGIELMRRVLLKTAVPYPKAQLRVCRPEQVFIPDANKRHQVYFNVQTVIVKLRSVKEIFRLITRQNEILNANEWQLVERVEKAQGVSTFHVDIDDGSYNALRQLNWRVAFLLTEVYISKKSLLEKIFLRRDKIERNKRKDLRMIVRNPIRPENVKSSKTTAAVPGTGTDTANQEASKAVAKNVVINLDNSPVADATNEVHVIESEDEQNDDDNDNVDYQYDDDDVIMTVAEEDVPVDSGNEVENSAEAVTETAEVDDETVDIKAEANEPANTNKKGGSG